MKRITLAIDEELLEAARQKAAAEGTTLDALFQRWLADYVGRKRNAGAAGATIRELR